MKHLFIDMDATICDYISTEGKVNIPDFSVPGLFINKRPIYIIMEAILKLYSTEEYVYHILSASPGSQGDLEKTDWLDFYFPVPYENRHFVRYPGENKAEFIAQYCKDNGINIQECTLLDDTQKHLKEAENIGVTAVHPAHLICEYEKKQELTNQQDKHIMLIKTIRGNIGK